ncbi:MAG: trypsin-like peptidase domain-containing protein [Candidatus Bathyarchaeia archaeon]
MEKTNKPTKPLFALILIALVAISLVAGGLIGYLMGYNPNSGSTAELQNQLSTLQQQTSTLQSQLATVQTQVNSIQPSTNVSTVTRQDLADAVANLQGQLQDLQTQILNLQTSQSQLAASQNTTSLQSDVRSLQSQITSLQTQLSAVQSQVDRLQQVPGVTYENITYVVGENVSLSQLFDQVKASVVVIQGLVRQVDFFGRVFYSQVQGSGFVYSHGGRPVVLTNNHVISGAVNITVTFTTGAVYPATVIGATPSNDFAVLNTTAPQSVYQPLAIVSSSTLKVGDPVIVVGTPYGLAGSMSSGIVSALNRTLTGDSTTISNIIQTTAPLNPGNSGGPVMNYQGQVVGIATAIVQESQGIGFAIPSDTVLAEIARIMS